MFHCFTCGIFKNHGICEACAANCHINHLVKFAGVQKFICECKNHETYKTLNVHALRDNRFICDRKVLANDDISPCYICNTCYKNGRKTICETCALKNHINHEIHFIGNIKFKCYENGIFDMFCNM